MFKKKVEIPDGWFVFEAGQNLIHMLWFANLLNVDDVLVVGDQEPSKTIRRVYVEEYDSFDECMQAAFKRIENGEIEHVARS